MPIKSIVLYWVCCCRPALLMLARSVVSMMMMIPAVVTIVITCSNLFFASANGALMAQPNPNNPTAEDNDNAHCFRISGTVGIAVDIGLKVNRLGIFAAGNLIWKGTTGGNNNSNNSDKVGIGAQLNAESRAYYCLNSYGPSVRRWEWQGGAAQLGCWGKKDSTLTDPFYGLSQNQTSYPYSIGYAHRIYSDNIGSSQRSGAFALQLKRWRLLLENDVLAGTGSDKFRTGAVRIAYQEQKWQIGLVNILWTCSHKGAKRVRDNATYKAKYGYYDVGANPWRMFSMGVAALSLKYAGLPYSRQSISAQLGLDDERIRHWVQNKWIHDMPFIPNKLNKARNPHIPMVASDSSLYLFAPGQKLRSTRLWLQMGLNSGDFY